MKVRAVALGVLTLCAGCGGPSHDASLPPVPLEGARAELRRLVGNWAGKFTNERNGRHGTIAFRLKAGEDTARGLILLERPPWPGCTDAVSEAVDGRVTGEIELTLAEVVVGGGRVGGWVRPYRDPELKCWMDTWFEGRIRGDTLEGMYFSNPADTAETLRLGTWWAARQR